MVLGRRIGKRATPCFVGMVLAAVLGILASACYSPSFEMEITSINFNIDNNINLVFGGVNSFMLVVFVRPSSAGARTDVRLEIYDGAVATMVIPSDDPENPAITDGRTFTTNDYGTVTVEIAGKIVGHTSITAFVVDNDSPDEGGPNLLSVTRRINVSNAVEVHN